MGGPLQSPGLMDFAPSPPLIVHEFPKPKPSYMELLYICFNLSTEITLHRYYKYDVGLPFFSVIYLLNIVLHTFISIIGLNFKQANI